jgi:LPS O-antigen subunit length determinant protein (WzzB/FepE family)
MTKSLPFKLLSPLGTELTKFLQRKDQPSALKEKVKEQKKRRIVNVMQAIERAPPSASVVKAVIPVVAEAKAKGAAEGTAEAEGSTMSEIDRLVSDIFADVTVETNVATEETMAAALSKERKIDTDPLGEEDFDLRHLGGQELS